MKRKSWLLVIVCIVFSVVNLMRNPKEESSAANTPSATYVALGDSIAAGYGLEGYQEGVGVKAPATSYQAILTKKLNAISVNDAITGITSDMLLEALNAGNYDKELLEATYVTISIGANDILTVFQEELCSVLGSNGVVGQELLANFQQSFQGKSFGEIATLLENIQKCFNNNEKLFAEAERFHDKLGTIVKLVRQKAPNADIYVNNIYNPYDGIDNPLLPLGKMAEPYIRTLNEAFNKYFQDYTLIDVYSIFKNTVYVNANFSLFHLDQLNLDPHPNENGHKVIAALCESAIKNNVPKAVHLSRATAGKGKIKVKIKTDEKSFEFNLESNGRLPHPMKFESKTEWNK